MRSVIKFSSFIFVVQIAVLTGIYVFINLHVFNASYLLVLSISAIINLILLGFYSLQFETFKFKINVVLIAVIMLVASVLKAFSERAIPGKVIDDFIFTLWKFDDSWPPIIKCVWHLIMDLLVLAAVIGIKRNTWQKEQKTMDVFLPADVRNKLSPFSSLMALIEEYFKEDEPQKKKQLEEFIKKELSTCEDCLIYLSGDGTRDPE